jgi:hypothetical protein
MLYTTIHTEVCDRFTEDGLIEQSFTEEELQDLLQVSGMQLTMSCLSFFAGIEDTENATKARDLIMNFPSFD